MRESLDHGKRKGNRLPFGDPDGARAELDKSVNEFIPLDQRNFSSGISSSELDRGIRVIVGKKGSGKTIYLRRLQDSARREESVFASKIAKDIPSTNSVIAFGHIFHKEKITEAWQAAWRIAILSSSFTHITCKQFFAPYVNQAELRQKYTELFGSVKSHLVERSPYSELKDVISRFRSERDYWAYASDSRWDDLQTILGNYLKSCPPIFMYLDASDDEFAHAPMDWHRCQKGLFYAVMRMLSQSGAIASRLHAVIAIRDIVYSSILESEHRTRYINSPSISLLDWNYSSIRYFYNRKLHYVDDDVFNDSKDKTSHSFLGLKKIHNVRRNIYEDAESYLLRHTRCLPRDVIQMGNAIAAEKVEVGEHVLDQEFWERRLRKVISKTSAKFADEQIQICANQLSSHEAPSRSAHHHYEELYTSDKEYISTRAQIIKDFIMEIGAERFGLSDLRDAEQKFKDRVPADVSLPTILWQQGLIGIRERDDERFFAFYSLKDHAGFMIPDTSAEYAFHSILLDAVPGISVSSSNPVREVAI